MPEDSGDEVVCPCGEPNKKENRIGCDNPTCPVKWFHFSCAQLQHQMFRMESGSVKTAKHRR